MIINRNYVRCKVVYICMTNMTSEYILAYGVSGRLTCQKLPSNLQRTTKTKSWSEKVRIKHLHSQLLSECIKFAKAYISLFDFSESGYSHKVHKSLYIRDWSALSSWMKPWWSESETLSGRMANLVLRRWSWWCSKSPFTRFPKEFPLYFQIRVGYCYHYSCWRTM